MKKILLVDASPRLKGNSESVVNTLTEDLKEHEVIVYKMRETKNNFCLACEACQRKDTQNCVQADDYTNLLPVIDKCDAIVIATPIYNQQISSMAKLFIERWYPFFKYDAPFMSNSSKLGKKGALVCSFWGSPIDLIKKYAEWTVSGFSQIGCDKTKAVLFPQIPGRGDVLKKDNYVNEIHKLAEWLAD